MTDVSVVQADVTEYERNVSSLFKHAQSFFTRFRGDNLVAHDGHYAGQSVPIVGVVFDKENRRHANKLFRIASDDA